MIDMLLAYSVLLGNLLLLPTPAVGDLRLPDLYGNEDRLSAHRDHVVLAMVVTAKRLRNIKAWEEHLHARFDGLHFLRIADLPEDSTATYEQVAKRLRQRVPAGVSVLIDLERRWADAFRLDTDRPNLLLFDRSGELAVSFRGRMEPELLEQVTAAIERLVNSE